MMNKYRQIWKNQVDEKGEKVICWAIFLFYLLTQLCHISRRCLILFARNDGFKLGTNCMGSEKFGFELI